MRNAFAACLVELAGKDPRIVLLSGDIGNRLFDPFKARFPDRFFNCGVAEANMTGLAAGLAMNDMRPITYTITPFNTLRCLEQIKLDVCYHNLPVTVVGVGAGLSYAGLGATHQAVEDIAILRALPNMSVVCPGDALEVRGALSAAMDYPGPVYLRLGKKNEPVVHAKKPEFVIGRGIVVREGNGACLLATGNTLPLAMDAATALEGEGVSCRVVSLHTVKPLDRELLSEVFSRFPVVAAIEEHMLAGGLGSAILEWASENEAPASRLLRFGMPDRFLHGAGNQANARKLAGLTAANVARKTMQALGR